MSPPYSEHTYKTTSCHTAETDNQYLHHREKLKSFPYSKKLRSRDMEGNWKYIEKTVADRRQGVVLQLGNWAED
jgi:hypothetical protein